MKKWKLKFVSQATIESIALTYDKEIENLVRESNIALKKCKNKIKQLSDNNKIDEKIKEIETKIEGEKNEFINQFNKYKEETLQKEKEMVSDYEEKIKKMNEELNNLKNNSQEEINKIKINSENLSKNFNIEKKRSKR